jgi:hypothetical protein
VHVFALIFDNPPRASPRDGLVVRYPRYFKGPEAMKMLLKLRLEVLNQASCQMIENFDVALFTGMRH